ncbi:hypothetical protein FACS189430_02700 [Bacteroidia bacterium]|nr:hypothetical protein FACS189430_02700 [Bacteroidia bacterium]
MKKRSILKSAVLAATFGLLSTSGANAQSSSAGNYTWWTKAAFPGSFQLQGGSQPGELSGAYEWFGGGTPPMVDTVSIGARVPYFIEGDPDIDAYVNATPKKLNPSQFKWVFTKTLGGSGYGTGGYTPAKDTLNLVVNQGLSTTPAEKSDVAFTGVIGSSVVASANLKGKGYYNVASSNVNVSTFTPALDLTKGMKEINVKFTAGTTSYPSSVNTPGLAVGDQIHLLINELPVTTAGVPICEGTDASGIGDSVATIKVVALPKLEWSVTSHTDVVGCSQDSITIGGLTKIYGYGPFVVSYQIEKGTYDATNNTFTPTPGAAATVDSTLFGTVKDAFPVGGAAGYEYMFLPTSAFTGAATGQNYRVTFRGLTDRFSRKSLDYLAGSIPGGGTVGSGFADDPSFVITIIDAPKTKKLKHVKNNRG